MFPLSDKGLHMEAMKYVDISDSFRVELKYLEKRAANQQIRIILTMKIKFEERLLTFSFVFWSHNWKLKYSNIKN
jgi:uncharacterized protein (DUF1684 family)